MFDIKKDYKCDGFYDDFTQGIFTINFSEIDDQFIVGGSDGICGLFNLI